MATHRAHLYLGWLFGVIFLGIGIERTLRTAHGRLEIVIGEPSE